jgi:hypothetical protein
MTINEVVYWTLWAFIVVLFLVLYLRVDWHDWGAVGMTGVMFAATVLLSRSLLRNYGYQLYVGEMLVLWRVLVLIFAPMAVLGFGIGLVRNPVPPGQIARRLAALAVALVAALFIIDVIVRSPL